MSGDELKVHAGVLMTPVDATPGDAPAGKKKKKKLGKKERMKRAAKEMEASGMSQAEARAAVGLNPLHEAKPAAGGDGGKAMDGRGRGGETSGRRMSGGARRGNGPSPALLTANIKNAGSLEELFGIHEAHASRLNHIHQSALWSALGRMTGGARDGWMQTHEEAVQNLVEHTVEMIESGQSELRGRELANVAHGAAKCGIAALNERLMRALAVEIKKNLGQCNSQEVANIAWAYAKGEYFESELFSGLVQAAERLTDRFNSQELTNITWAFATANESDVRVFKALAKSVERKLGEFNTQGLSNTAWAFAKAGYVDAALFRAIAQAAQDSINNFNAQDFSNLAWAFAKASQYDAMLFTTLAKHARKHLDTLNAQGLTNTVWAFAKAGHLDAELFSSFSRAIEHRMFMSSGDFNSQDIANTAWSFAKACHMDEKLFSVLARTAESCLDDFNTQDLVNTTWACAKLGHFDDKLFKSVRKSIVDRRLDDLDAPNIANIAWTFDKANQLDPVLAQSLARAAERRVNEFTPQDLANVAWTFANAGQTDEKLFSALANTAERLMDNFGEEELDNLEWAFTKAGQQVFVKSLKKQKKSFDDDSSYTSNCDVDVSKCGRIIVAGGGIGGAAAAVALQNKGFDVLVLESDESFDARAQGYGLTVQAQDAIQAMGIDLSKDDAPSTSHYTFSSDGEIIGFFGEAFGAKSKERQEVQNSGRFIHIPRQVLRSRIVEAVQPGTIRWASKLKSFTSNDGEGVSVTLMDGTALDGALLVGSDGIFSTVRRQLNLPGDRLNYVGLCVVLGILHEDVMSVPLAERRIFETVDGTTRLYAMPFTTTSTMWQLSFPCSEETARMYTKDAATLKAEITRRCADWHSPVPDMLQNTPLDCMSGYPVYDRELLEPEVLRPNGKDTKSQRRVTLIGDAAHPMTPFKAQGANQAMSDAVLLADTLVMCVQKHGPTDGFDRALPIFERKMLSRSSRMVVGSREKAKEMHSALAMQPARKAQREAEFDMQEVIRILREKKIGAQNAIDSRGLDAVVEAEAINSLNGSSATRVQPQGTKVIFADTSPASGDKKGTKRKSEKLGKSEKAEKKEKKEKKDKKEKKEKKEKKRKADVEDAEAPAKKPKTEEPEQPRRKSPRLAAQAEAKEVESFSLGGGREFVGGGAAADAERQTPDEYRKTHSITCKGDDVPDPFQKFSDAPWEPKLQAESEFHLSDRARRAVHPYPLLRSPQR